MTIKRVNNAQDTVDSIDENSKQSTAPKPLRLRASLYQIAAQHAALEHRSIPKQIEYWAEIGRWMATKIGDREIYALLANNATINVTMEPTAVVSVDQAHSALEKSRSSGTLGNAIHSEFIYDTDPSNPDFIRETTANGSQRYGEFVDGEFVVAPRTG